MDKEKRKLEIKRAIDRIGFAEVRDRIKNDEDRKIYLEIVCDFQKENKKEVDEELKNMGIQF